MKRSSLADDRLFQTPKHLWLTFHVSSQISTLSDFVIESVIHNLVRTFYFTKKNSASTATCHILLNDNWLTHGHKNLIIRILALELLLERLTEFLVFISTCLLATAHVCLGSEGEVA